jgi:hypothetical protein
MHTIKIQKFHKTKMKHYKTQHLEWKHNHWKKFFIDQLFTRLPLEKHKLYIHNAIWTHILIFSLELAKHNVQKNTSRKLKFNRFWIYYLCNYALIV